MSNIISKQIDAQLGSDPEPFTSVTVNQLTMGGWTARDPIAQEKHMAELEELGITRPASAPVFYRVAAARLTTADAIEVSGQASSGEVEAVLLQANGQLWVGLGSDHTDRNVETYSITVSKQMCDKPISTEWWNYEELANHWDNLLLRSWITREGIREAYQEGSVSRMLHPDALISKHTDGQKTLLEGSVLFCGTLPAIGGIRPTSLFEMELHDPVKNRSLKHAYKIIELPIAG